MKTRVLFLSGALWLVTALPALVGYIAAPAGQTYLARIHIVAADTTAYYSNIEQARQGRLLFTNQFTSEPQRPTWFHPLWLVTGWLGAATSLATPVAYHLVRFVAVLLFVWLLDRIIGRLWPDRTQQGLALIIVTTSAGLGWVMPGSDTNPLLRSIDLWVAESVTFQSIGHSALFIGSQALLLWCLWSVWSWIQRPDRLPKTLGPASALLTLIHPYDLVTMAAVAAAAIAWQYRGVSRPRPRVRDIVRLAAWCGAWVIPVAGYFIGVVLREPAMAGWLSQNIDITPTPPFVLAGYGLLIPLAMFGAWRWNNVNRTFLVIWAVIGCLIIYMPIIDFQRRLLSGIHIPIALLAAHGVFLITTRVVLPWMRLAATIGFVLILSLTNIQNSLHDVAITLVPRSVDYPVYAQTAEIEALAWLKTQTDFSDVIWSEVWLGNAIPGQIGRTVVMGHGHQTLKLQHRLREWLAFRRGEWSADVLDERIKALRITWLVWRASDEWPDGYRPETDSRWRLARDFGPVQLYRLQSQ